MGKYCRSFRYIQTKKCWTAFNEWYEEYGGVISGRSRQAIPMRLDPWDDTWRCYQRSWKKHRNHQYREKTESHHAASERFGTHMKRRDHWHLEHKHCSYRPCKHCKKNNVEYIRLRTYPHIWG